ncbi:MAG: phage major capsid protein [Gemmatimonadota bacterium]|nr:phage major capsid protein [Gemmatimonadota bacterium]
MNLAEMRARINAASTDLGALAQKSERSADDESRLDQLIAEINDLGPKIERELSIEAASGRATTLGESRGRVSGTLPAAGAEHRDQPEAKADHRPVGQRFAESDQLKRAVQTGSRQSEPMEVGSFYQRHAATIQHNENMGPEDVRALVYTGAMPTEFISPQIVPGFFRGDLLQGTVRDVLINGQTQSDAITFFRETAFTNNAAGVAEATATTGTTGLKPESAITFEQATATMVTIAHWIPITQQTLQDAAQMQTYVEQRLLDGLRLRESDQLLNGSGAGANMTGLRNTTGVQYLDNTVTTGYWAVNPVNDAGTDNENFNRLLRAKRLVRTTGRAVASFIVLNPADLEGFLNRTDAQRQYFGGGPFQGTAIPTMWGLRVVEDENLAAGESLVGDGRMAAVWDRMQAQILIDTIDDQFVRNMLTILAEERLGLTVFRPQAFVRCQLAAFT